MSTNRGPMILAEDQRPPIPLVQSLHCVMGPLEPPNKQVAVAILKAHRRWLEHPLLNAFRWVVVMRDPTEPMIDWKALRAHIASLHHPSESTLYHPAATESDYAVLRLATLLALDDMRLGDLNPQHRAIVKDHIVPLFS